MTVIETETVNQRSARSLAGNLKPTAPRNGDADEREKRVASRVEVDGVAYSAVVLKRSRVKVSFDPQDEHPNRPYDQQAFRTTGTSRPVGEHGADQRRDRAGQTNQRRDPHLSVWTEIRVDILGDPCAWRFHTALNPPQDPFLTDQAVEYDRTRKKESGRTNEARYRAVFDDLPDRPRRSSSRMDQIGSSRSPTVPRSQPSVSRSEELALFASASFTVATCRAMASPMSSVTAIFGVSFWLEGGVAVEQVGWPARNDQDDNDLDAFHWFHVISRNVPRTD